jgi:hypothetical protein
MNPNQPRLLPDFAAAPTRRERAGARNYWQDQQRDLFAEPVAEPEQVCPVCASRVHDAGACPFGTAPALFDTPEPEQVRAMFRGFGWSVTEPN